MTDSELPKGSLDRGLTILTYLSTAGESPVSELATVVGMSRSAAYRIVDRLREADYVVDSDAGRVKLGPAAARLAMAAVQTTDVVHVAPELLRLLAQQTRETVGLGVLSGDEMVFVYRERGPQSVTVNAELGARRPLHCTAIGKAYLSAMTAAERRALVRAPKLTRYTERTITSRTELDRELETSRNRGWTVERGEFDDASTCCGAPILDHTGAPVAAISVAGLRDRMENVLDRVGPTVASTADAISRRLGYNPDASPSA
ncbi:MULTISPECIES: IclR family transcriptional regulator [Prauserella salsuginis group]|uniref:IclR family transcriptional regulator n=1 Tax=Prauserella salsuginis TaxID=387889 RepID=A0ABW6G114_9PSEU|nr:MULTISPECIES: IclR family transcriptional regulator [Prauserella salsuginis group]MCR3722005.1 transcriptional regulator, IclR family [Prauserella flava]MCR3736011.1 transcriptional regulator, IclR family [Prauserella salsuginis]